MLSPLQLKGHRFSALEVKALPHGLTDGRVQVSTRVGWSPHAGYPGEWQLTLHVTFGPADPKTPAPYQGSAEIAGLFNVDPDWPADQSETLVQVNGASILYGAVREMILGVTARSTHGEFLLPTVSFVEPERPVKQPTKGGMQKHPRTRR